jgi:hypothetical protein
MSHIEKDSDGHSGYVSPPPEISRRNNYFILSLPFIFTTTPPRTTRAMSFDAFEARMQFLQLLRKLNASQQSIHKVVGYAIKYGSKCGEDLWECILEECGKVCPLAPDGMQFQERR